MKQKQTVTLPLMAAAIAVTAGAVVVPLPQDGDRFAWQRVEWQQPLPAPPSLDSLLVWDYSHAAELDRDREVRYVVVDDTIVARLEPTYQVTYLLRGDTVRDTGSESQRVSLRATTPPSGEGCGEGTAPVAAFRSMPLGTVIHSPLEFIGLYCGQNATRSRGWQTVTADAAGTLLLPTGDTIAGVTRVRTLRDATIELSRNRDHIDFDTDSVRHLRRRDDICRLYAPGYPYPLVENVETTCYVGTATHVDSVTMTDRRAYVFPPASQEYALQRSGTQGDRLAAAAPDGGTSMPSAALTALSTALSGGTLTVNFTVGVPNAGNASSGTPSDGMNSATAGPDTGGAAWVEVVVSDLQGMVWASAPRRLCTVGDHTVTLDLSALRPGRYLVAAFTPDSRLTDIIDR